TLRIPCACFSRHKTSFPASRFHSRTVLSSPPVSAQRPSLEMANPYVLPLCPAGFRTSFPVSISQTHSSLRPAIKCLPTGNKATPLVEFPLLNTPRALPALSSHRGTVASDDPESACSPLCENATHQICPSCPFMHNNSLPLLVSHKRTV